MKVLLVQPYVPNYRVPLFSRLDELLQEDGGSLTVAASRPDCTMAQRRDEGSGPWLRYVDVTSLQSPLGQIRYRALRPVLDEAPDVVVMELDPSNLNAWTAAARYGERLVLWGHGKTYTGPERPLVAHARTFLARKAHHVMTYTESGRAALVAQGVPPTRVTAIGNATDSIALTQALAQRRQLGTARSLAFDTSVEGRRVFSFIGGMDSDKRIAFLAQAAVAAYAMDPRFLLLAAGSGADERHIDALDAGIARRIPRAGVEALADMLSVSEGIWMPGRIGLVACDALVAGVPIHTTSFPYHAPEFDFLRIGYDVLIHSGEAAAYAAASLEHQASHALTSGDTAGRHPTIEQVASNMHAVLKIALRKGSRAHR